MTMTPATGTTMRSGQGRRQRRLRRRQIQESTKSILGWVTGRVAEWVAGWDAGGVAGWVIGQVAGWVAEWVVR